MNLNEKTKDYFKTKDFYPAILFILTLILRTFFTNQLYTATAITGADEIGTIASAAYFAGYDWSGVISDTLYYSFGYSMLLAPVFAIFKNPETIHHMLLFINNILIASCGVITYKIQIRFFKIKNKTTAVLISSITMLYVPLYFNGNILLNECMLQFMIWATLYLILLLNENDTRKKNIYTILLSLSLFYSLLVHTRSIVMIGTVIITILGILIVCKKNIINPYLFYPTAIAGYFLSKFFVKGIQSKLWLTNDNINLKNSTESVFFSLFSNIKLLFTFEGFKVYLLEMIGQVYTMITLTYGLFIISCIVTTIFLFHLFKKRKIIEHNNYYTSGIICVLFGFIGLFTTSMLSSLNALELVWQTWGNGQANKFFLYSRYWSIYMPIILMLSGCFLYRYMKFVNHIIITACFFVLSVFFLFNSCIGFKFRWQGNLATGVFYPFFSIGFWEPTGVITESTFSKFSIFLIIIFLLLCLCLKTKKVNLCYVALCIMMFINYAYGTYNISIKISDQLHEQFGKMVQIVDDSAYTSEYIYTYGNFSNYKLWLQYLFPRLKIAYGIEDTQEAIAITDRFSEEFIGNGWNLVYHDNDSQYLLKEIYMFAKGDEIVERLAKKGYEVVEICEGNLTELTGYMLMPQIDLTQIEVLGPIASKSIEQKFYLSEDMKDTNIQLEILMTNYARKNEGTVRIELMQNDNILTYDVSKNTIQDNNWLKIEIYNHGFATGEATVKITDLENDMYNSIGLYISNTGSIGDLYWGNEKLNGELRMRIKAI